ncbi:MAG: hypothetical protein Q9219_006162 [cf. Caloplaca sp. 3 TL-2023]
MSGKQQIRCIRNVMTYIRQVAALKFPALPPDKIPIPTRPKFYKSKQEHTRLLKFGRDILHRLSQDTRIREAATPTLYHNDLHKRNVYVLENDPTTITGLIDWQSSSIAPAFEYADDIPDFAELNSTYSEDDQLAEDDPAIFNARLCRKAFDVSLQGYIPNLFAARALDENLIRPFRYCHRTWKDGAVALERDLIEVSSRWTELGLPNDCPYPLPTSDEMSTHNKGYDDFKVAQKLKQELMSHLDTPSDGWVPNECWELMKSTHKEAFDTMAQAMRDAKKAGDEEASEEFLRQMWPFDLD